MTSNYVVIAKNCADKVRIFRRKNPVSTLVSAKKLFKCPPSNIENYPDRDWKKWLWMKAIFQGHHDRQKKFNRKKLNSKRNKLTAVIEKKLNSEDLASLIVSFLSEYNVDEEGAQLIKQAEKKFNRNQQS